MFSEKVHVMNHPLVAHKLTILRDKNTSVKDFRELVSEIGMLITYEATRDLPLTTKVVETPLCKAELPTLAGKKFAVVPILRAGLGLVDGPPPAWATSACSGTRKRWSPMSTSARCPRTWLTATSSSWIPCWPPAAPPMPPSPR